MTCAQPQNMSRIILWFIFDNISRYQFEKSTDNIFTLECHCHLSMKYNNILFYKVKGKVLRKKTKVTTYKELKAMMRCFKYEE